MRKHIVEPVFGWVKQVLGFRRFSMRCHAAASGEWQLVCSAVNLRRLSTRLQFE
jgi:Transposase DDE domain